MPDSPRSRLAAAASARHGVVTVAEATDLGVSRAMLRTDIGRGQWHVAAPGTLVATSAPSTWHQRVAVACVSTGGVASHRSAARLHGFDGHQLDLVEVSVLRPVRRVRPGTLIHQAGALDPRDITTVDALRVTTVARTLVDLGAVVGDDLVEQALDDALRRGASPRWIEECLSRVDRPGPSGTAALRRVLGRPDRAGPLPDSMLERLLERAATAAGLPRPQRQVQVRNGAGRLVAVLDAAWPDRLVGCEAQSERWHGGPRGAQRDLDRHNLLTSMGWRMLYATWADVRSPEQFTARLAELYRSPAPATGR
jgi:hypothetical protein